GLRYLVVVGADDLQGDAVAAGESLGREDGRLEEEALRPRDALERAGEEVAQRRDVARVAAAGPHEHKVQVVDEEKVVDGRGRIAALQAGDDRAGLAGGGVDVALTLPRGTKL